MGRSKPKKNKVFTFESVGNLGGKTDVFARLYASMLYSPAYMALNNRQRMLYVYAKLQFYGHRKPGADFPEIPNLQGVEYFYFPISEGVKSGLYTKNMGKELGNDLKELGAKGFIDIVVTGNRGKKSIYRFSNRWINYDPESHFSVGS